MDHLLEEGLVPLGIAIQVRHELLPRGAHQVLGQRQVPERAQRTSVFLPK